MPHLLKEYSKNLGVEPSKPFVNKHFYPIQSDNYIVIYNEQDIQSKNYRYYEIALGLIKQALKSADIDVVLIGSEKQLFGGVDYYYPNLGFRKNCYIVSKAKAFISIDNALTQYASCCGVPVVNLYGNIYPSITTPYWSNKKNKIDLEPTWDKKPSLALVDPKDPINEIPVEKVAQSILKVLGFPDSVKVQFKTKRKNKAKMFQVDVIPTNYVNLPVFKNNILNIRLDQGQIDQQSLFNYCTNHVCNLILKDTIPNVETLKVIGKNVKNIVFITTRMPEKIPDLYFDLLKRMNINFLFLVREKSIIDDIRLEYFDQDVELQELDKEKPSDIDLTDKFISFKTVIEGDKSYKCLAHWKKKIDSDNNIVDNLSYWEELDYFYIYEQEDHS